MLSLLGPLASLLGLEAGALADKAKRTGIMWATIAVFGLVAFVFLLVAINTALTYSVGPVWAPVIVAGAAMMVALLTYLVARITSEVAHRREVERRKSSETTALVTTAAFAALPMLLKSPLLKRVGLPLGGAIAAYYLLTRPGPGDDSGSGRGD